MPYTKYGKFKIGEILICTHSGVKNKKSIKSAIVPYIRIAAFATIIVMIAIALMACGGRAPAETTALATVASATEAATTTAAANTTAAATTTAAAAAAAETLVSNSASTTTPALTSPKTSSTSQPPETSSEAVLESFSGKFSIEGKWKQTGDNTFGQAQKGSIIIFDGARCNWYSPADTYAFYKDGDNYRLDTTNVLFGDTPSFIVVAIDNDNIDIYNGPNAVSLKRVQ